jgi:hypothetical protein
MTCISLGYWSKKVGVVNGSGVWVGYRTWTYFLFLFAHSVFEIETKGNKNENWNHQACSGSFLLQDLFPQPFETLTHMATESEQTQKLPQIKINEEVTDIRLQTTPGLDGVLVFQF